MPKAMTGWRTWRPGDRVKPSWVLPLIIRNLARRIEFAVLGFRRWQIDRWRRRLDPTEVETVLATSEAHEREAEARGDQAAARDQRNFRLWLVHGSLSRAR